MFPASEMDDTTCHVDSTHANKGPASVQRLSRSLVCYEAVARCAAAVDDIGGRAVLVHAKDAGAAAFYQRYGFVSLEQNPNHLYVLMKNLRASIRRSIE